MEKKFRLLLLLALLLTAATGAWAQTTTEVSTFADLKSALISGNNVKLTSDITCTEQITIEGVKVKINGNGKKLIGSSCRAFYVNSSAVLCMKDLTVTGFDLNAGGGAINNYYGSLYPSTQKESLLCTHLGPIPNACMVFL